MCFGAQSLNLALAIFKKYAGKVGGGTAPAASGGSAGQVFSGKDGLLSFAELFEILGCSSDAGNIRSEIQVLHLYVLSLQISIQT